MPTSPVAAVKDEAQRFAKHAQHCAAANGTPIYASAFHFDVPPKMQNAAKAKQERVRALNEAAAKGGPNAPSQADRIRAVTELVKLKQREARAARKQRM